MLVPGALIDGKYRIVRLLGEGGMGAVYEGENVRIERRVAIKVMHPSIAKDRALVGRFEREAQAAAKIGSVHVADVLDLGDLPNGERYLVMEFLEGENLHSRLVRRKTLAPVDIAHIAIQLLEGLAMVHEAGIIHRDLKPANVFLAKKPTGGDFVKILDFGICKMVTRASLSEGGGGGDLLGTLPYMSPEQLGSAQKVDVRADIFSVGVILYRCVTGSFPFHGINLVEHARQLRGRPKDIRELARDVDATFAYTVHTAIATDRNDRYATARELQTALVEWMNRAQSIENLLGDYLGMNLRSDRPPQDREPSNPPKATDIPRKIEIDRPTIAEGKSNPSKTKEDVEVPLLPTTRAQPRRPGDRPLRSTKKLPEPARKPAPRTLPMQNAPTIPGMRTPTVPEMAASDEPDPKTTRRRR